MQYTHRKLHRSVIEIRRFVWTRPYASTSRSGRGPERGGRKGALRVIWLAGMSEDIAIQYTRASAPEESDLLRGVPVHQKVDARHPTKVGAAVKTPLHLYIGRRGQACSATGGTGRSGTPQQGQEGRMAAQ